MEKNKYIFIFLLALPVFVFAQAKPAKYIVYFKNKPSCKNIESLFSEKSLEKRKKFNIPFDERDYPLSADYITTITENHIPILDRSNWLNAVIVLADENKIALVHQLPFVTRVTKIKVTDQPGVAAIQNEEDCEEVLTFEDTYSSSFPQFHLLNGEYLHEQGYNGENMTIAICDGGFIGANTNACFAHIRAEGRLLGTYDYVNHDSTVYESISHGTNVLSCIAGIINNQYLGTARKAKFYLFMTENAPKERLQEEFNLATALERCDQLGVDVVNISLGYTTFDSSFENHDTSDMMKNNTPAAIAVNIASNKGILVVVAAGNEGANAWHYISTPSDADSAFAIAAVDVNGNPASFSGWGLATDPRVKPNVAAVGWNMKVISPTNTVVTSSGTSFASPSLAGMATCLWQAFPTKTNWEIKTAIEQSASQYLTPDKHIGYGIPDFKKAYDALRVATFVSNPKLENELFVYPNPFENTVSVTNTANVTISNIQLMNNMGQVVFSQDQYKENTIALNDLPKGMYLMQIATNHGLLIKKLIKD